MKREGDSTARPVQARWYVEQLLEDCSEARTRFGTLMKPNLRDRGVEILEDYRAKTMLKSFGYGQVDAVESSIRAVHGAHADSSS